MKELSLDNCRLEKRYDIFAQLGRGSYAEIFAARDTAASPESPHRFVAIKALNVFLQDDLDPDLERTLVENFQNEAVALDRVRHPNIISRLGHGTARDSRGTLFHYLVLEYLEGGDLQKACREDRPDIGKALGYVEQTCAGLRHAHSRGVIHRDIKPQNLLFTKDRSTVKIADFGVARIDISDAPITRVGTNIYAAPEHSPLSGDGNVMVTAKLTPAADIYSLAKSVYTLVTGESPRFYAGQPITDLPLSVRNEEWADELKRVLLRGTERDPSERHQSVDEFWQDLAGIRQYVKDYETSTRVRPKFHAVPQPHIAHGYSPIAPRQAHFDTSRDLRLKHPFGPGVAAAPVKSENGINHRLPLIENSRPIVNVQAPAVSSNSQLRIEIPNAVGQSPAAVPKRKRRVLRSLAGLTLFLLVFGSALYFTHSLLKNAGLVPDISTVFSSKTGRANTDINLRPEPSVNNEPIGLVTRNSRLRIVKTQNNWYQVDVIEQGRARDDQLRTTRGWLNGRYVDIDDN